jgi:L-2-hydroxycarboxylate dehydrogenase (NAD+)
MSGNEIRVPAHELLRFCANVFERLGVAKHDADLWANVIVETSLRGVDSHGILVLPLYAQMLEAGGIKIDARVEIISDHGATVLLDGGHGIGPVVADTAMTLAIERARQFGISYVTVRNSNHFGMAAYYAAKSLDHDMIGMAFTNAGPAIAAWGGRSKVIGSNALAVAVPAGKELPIIFDTAIGASAAAKIFVAAEKGERIPIDWMIDGDGHPTDDPNALFSGGVMLPFGKHKGYGIGIIIDVLTGVLSGGLFSTAVKGFGRDMSESLDVCHSFCALDIRRFIALDQFRSRVDHMIREIKRSEPVEGVDRVYLPGEKSFFTRIERNKLGIPLWSKLAADLRNFSDRLNVEFPVN